MRLLFLSHVLGLRSQSQYHHRQHLLQNIHIHPKFYIHILVVVITIQ